MNLELTINKAAGEPVIKVLHHAKSSKLDELVLGDFIEKSLKNGVGIVRVSDILSSEDSWEQYYIKTNEPKLPIEISGEANHVMDAVRYLTKGG